MGYKYFYKYPFIVKFMVKKYIGGQALLGGVMMKGREFVAAVVENDKKYSYYIKRIKPLPNIFEIPFIRGFIHLIEMMIIGLRTLIWSGNQQLEKDEQESMSNSHIFFLILTSFIFAIGLFVILPLFLTKIFISDGSLLFNLIDGLIRVIIFILYIVIIGKMDDISEVYKYHGAEHKTVNCYEANKKLTVKNVKSFSTVHPRCGTTFIFIVLIISILLFSVIKSNDWFVQFAIRVLFIPLIAGISFEILRFTANHCNNFFIKIIMKPGLMLQSLTTKEPEDDKIKVAILAINKVIELEKKYKIN